MEKKGLIINDLAGMVQRGFESADKKIDEFRDGVNERFNALDNRLDAIVTNSNL